MKRKKIFTKIMSVILTITMMMVILPFNAYASTSSESVKLPTNQNTETTSDSLDGLIDQITNSGTSSGGGSFINFDPVSANELSYEIWDGNTIATELPGEGTKESPYTISNGEELMHFAEQVNGGNTYEGKHIHLKANIDMDMFNNEKTWMPIGVSSSNPFMGTFDGECHEVINLNIAYGEHKMSAVNYIGFFGYAKNAVIVDFGIYSYKIDQEYKYDTQIGALVAHLEGTTVNNCYASGEISASFVDENPLDRSDVITLTSVPDTLSYANPYGQGVILDLRNASTTVNKTMTVGGDVSAIRIIGSTSKTYTGFNIVISGHSSLAMYISLENVNILGGSGNAVITSSSNRQIVVNNVGTSTVTASSEKIGINAPSAELIITGSGTFTVRGGSGVDRSNVASGNGGNGADGIVCNAFYSVSEVKAYVYGGNGGAGGKGNDASPVTSVPSRPSEDHGKTGYVGYNGANGGNGGKGGYAINAGRIVANQLNLYGGTGGNAGDGGKGGKGGKGGPGAQQSGLIAHAWFNWSWNGGAGGTGGRGGDSGYPGSGASAFSSSSVVEGNIFISTGGPGKVGTPGAGGEGGDGGDPGYRKGSILFIGTSYLEGSRGAKGGPGSSGTQRTTSGSASTATVNKTISSSYSYEGYTKAFIWAGGLFGYVDTNSKSEFCASVSSNTTKVNRILAHNTVTMGSLVGDSLGNIKNAVSAELSGETLTKITDVNKWFGAHADNRADMALSVLNDSTDVVGLIYDNGITDGNTVAKERSVVGKNASEYRNITIPDYVFSGRFITPVTEIRGREYNGSSLKHYGAFETNYQIGSVTCGPNMKVIGDLAFKGSSITKIVTGDSVEKIGEEAFANCSNLKEAILGDNVSKIGLNLFNKSNDLENIVIGKSLTNIPDIDNKSTPFGLEKSMCSLREYVISPENIAYRSVNGILYELFEIKATDGGSSSYITVAIIDVPVFVEIENFAPVDHVVKIYPNAFAHNKTIKTVKLDYIRDIGEKAFFSAENLRSVKFGTPEVVDSEYITILDKEVEAGRIEYSQVVGIDAFKGCVSLESVNLESEFITKIGSGAFSECATKLGVQPLNITLGKNITSINANYDELYNGVEYELSEQAVKAFFDVFEGSKIASFNVVEGNRYYLAIDGVLYLRTATKQDGKDVIWLIAYPRNKTALYDSNGRDIPFEIPLMDNMIVTRVTKGAFSGAENLRYLNINNGVITVDNGALTNAKMYNVTFGKDVQYIGTTDTGTETMFNGCTLLTSIYVEEENEKYSDCNGVLYNKEQTVLIKYPQAMSGYEFVAPSTVNEVDSFAFSGNLLIRRVTFKSEIDKVGVSAFNGCSNLSIVYFKFGDSPFESKEKLLEDGVFETNNPRTIICYGEESESWAAIEGDYFNKETGANVKLFSVEKFAGYPEDVVDTGYYAVVVVDKSGAPINDIYVTIGETVKTQGGIAVFYNLDYSTAYKLRVVDNHGEFFPIENGEFYPDEGTRVTYITLSTVPTVSGVSVSYESTAKQTIQENIKEDDSITVYDYIEVIGGKDQVHDINSETAKINTWAIPHINITVNCGFDKGAEITGYQLVQDGIVIKSFTSVEDLALINVEDHGGKKLASIEIPVNTSILMHEKDLYVVVEFTDSKTGVTNQVQTKLNLHIFSFCYLGFDIGALTLSKFSLTVDEAIPLIGGAKLELFNPKVTDPKTGKPKEHYINIGIGADYFRVILNDEKVAKDFKFGDNWSGDNYDRHWGHTWEENSKNKIGLSLGGYLEVKYKGVKEDGSLDLAYTSSITGTIKYTLSKGMTRTIWVIPVRLEMELTLEGKLTFSLVFDKEAEKFVTPGLTFEFKGVFQVSAGVGCRLASAGVYGNVKTVLVIDIIPDFEVRKWTLSGDLGAYVKYDGLFVKFKKSWSFFGMHGVNNEWVIYENGYWWYEDKPAESSEEALTVSAHYDESNYEIAKSSFDPSVMTFSLRGIQEEPENAYSGIDPKMIQVGDLIYIVYQNDLNGYSDKYDEYNYQKIVYQTYNIKTEEFSEVFVLDDNGYADGSFDVYYNGTDAVIAYTQLNRKLTTDNIDDMSAYVGSLEVKTAVLSDGAFIHSNESMTSDSYYDMNLRVGEINGNITAVWVKNAENTMFGTTDNNNMSIWYSIYADGEWSDPVCLKSGINTITDIDIGERGVVYITDTNNDFTTVGEEKAIEGYTDRLITVVDILGNSVLLTLEEGAYHDVSYIENEIVYYKEGNVYSVDTDSAYFNESILELTEDYIVLVDDEGVAKAILFVGNVIYDEESGANGSNIFAIFNNNNVWGSPVQITNFGEGAFVSAFDAIDFGDKMFMSVLLSNIEYNENSNDEYDSYTTINSFESIWCEYPTDYTMQEVTFDYESIVPNEDAILTIQIVNNGYEALTEVPVTISRGNELFSTIVTKFYDEDGHELAGGLPSGQTGYVKVMFNVGEVDDVTSYTVAVNDCEQELKLWYSEFAVFGKQVIIGDKYHIVGRITNNGYVSAQYTLTAMIGDVMVCEPKMTGILNHGETEYFTIPLEHNIVNSGSNLVILKLDADDEYIVVNNEAQINIATDEIQDVDVDFMSVWLSEKAITISKSDMLDANVDFDEKYDFSGMTVNGVSVDDAGVYFVENNTITFITSQFTKLYDHGEYLVRIEFADQTVGEDGNIVYKYATISLTVTEFFDVVWVVDGEEVFADVYEVGNTPVDITASRERDAEYTYEFIGWDYNGDGEVDEMKPVKSDMVLVALFANHINYYDVVWSVNGVESEPESYAYGAVPSYNGSYPTKESDVQFDYVFTSWDKEISPVTGNTTYYAVFDSILRKYNITIVLDDVSIDIQAEYGTIPKLPIPTKAPDIQYTYSFAGWSPEVSTVYGDQTYVAEFDSALQKYTVTWNIEGEETEVIYEYGEIPEYEGTPTKMRDKQYSYSFAGWNQNINPVDGDITYIALFDYIINSYTVTFDVNGEAHSEVYEYGSTPEFVGETHKSHDETYRYVFAGWDKDLAVVEEDVTYVAQYDAIVRGKAKATNTTFSTAWNCEFTTTISLRDIQDMNNTVLTLYYNADVVELKSYSVCDGITVVESGNGYINIKIDGMVHGEDADVMSIVFKTKETAPVGEFDFLQVWSEDAIVSDFSKMTIYQLGDVNMDGAVNNEDAAMIQQYVIKKTDLNEVQKVYANVSCDFGEDGSANINTVDAAMIKQYVAGKVDVAGNRITINFVDGESVITMSIIKGSCLNINTAEGYAWSLSENQYVSVDFASLTKDTTVYFVAIPE